MEGRAEGIIFVARQRPKNLTSLAYPRSAIQENTTDRKSIRIRYIPRHPRSRRCAEAAAALAAKGLSDLPLNWDQTFQRDTTGDRVGEVAVSKRVARGLKERFEKGDCCVRVRSMQHRLCDVKHSLRQAQEEKDSSHIART